MPRCTSSRGPRSHLKGTIDFHQTNKPQRKNIFFLKRTLRNVEYHQTDEGDVFHRYLNQIGNVDVHGIVVPPCSMPTPETRDAANDRLRLLWRHGCSERPPLLPAKVEHRKLAETRLTSLNIHCKRNKKFFSCTCVSVGTC